MTYTDKNQLIADSVEELHDFARAIGLRPGWFRTRDKCPTYDIWYWPLIRALKKGCEVISTEQLENKKMYISSQ